MPFVRVAIKHSVNHYRRYCFQRKERDKKVALISSDGSETHDILRLYSERLIHKANLADSHFGGPAMKQTGLALCFHCT